VIVGGGIGGLACAQRLARRGGGVEVTLIDRRLRHDFPPSFPWLMTGERTPEAVSRSLPGLRRLSAELIEAEVTSIDLERGEVTTGSGHVPFDELVLAPGAVLAPESVPGLAEAAHGFYTREDAERLRDALAQFDGGRVLVAVAAMPFKCPAAPYEAAFLIEDLLRRRGVSATVDVVTAEPQPLPVAGPSIGAQVRALLDRRGIGFAPSRKLEAVDHSAGEAQFSDARESYDLLVAIPPHKAPEFVAASSLAGPQGWVPVDAATLRPDAEAPVHAIGDVTAIALPNGMMLPKAGVFAHAQAEVVAENLAAAAGSRPEARFDGHGSCFLEVGGGRAGFASGDFYASPTPVVRMRRPARWWHWGKVLVERRWLAREAS
jgi:sulfide:quinone oxidoreductase